MDYSYAESQNNKCPYLAQFHEGQNVGIVEINECTTDAVIQGINEIFANWTKNIKWGDLSKESYIRFENQYLPDSKYSESNAETWANILWGSNMMIGVGAAFIHHNDKKYLLCVVNYQYAPIPNAPISSINASWQTNIPQKKS